MADYWSKTGKLFGGLIEKPKMTDKLLKKPPPKYIYDIILNTMKKTGFPKGLFTPEEEDHKYFEADARHKMDILQKVIDITKIVMNENFDIKCTNILKGEQPDKTNYFLQLFYAAATNGKDNTPLINKYLEKKNKKAGGAPAPKEPEKLPEKKTIPDSVGKSKPMAQPDKKPEKPKGIISDGGGDDLESSMKDTGAKGEIKFSSGAGSGSVMKLDKKIFKHDITDAKAEETKVNVSKVDLESIKAYVQQITKNCNPLGKLVDILGDDIENMNKELANWIKENKTYKEKYDEEIKKSDETLLPLQNELLELEDSIKDEQMQINSIKSRLIKNEKIIQNLITNVISFKTE